MGSIPAFLDPDRELRSLVQNYAEPGFFGACFDFTLAPGEEWTCLFVITQQLEPRMPALARFDGIDSWKRSIGITEDWAAQVSGEMHLATPDLRLNSFVRTWLKKEIVWETRLWRNGITTPWRNELQDALGYALYKPEEALPFLELVTRKQDPGGYVKVWNTRDKEKPNHPLGSLQHTDGGIWLVICWTKALQLTGYFEWWTQPILYNDGTEGPLFEHLHRALVYSFHDRGPHGLVLFHDGDWTDPFNGPGRGGQGESGWATQALVFAWQQFLSLATLLGYDEFEIPGREIVKDLLSAIDDNLWTGTRYAYGFDDEGRRFGGDEEARIFLNTQSWGLISQPDAHSPELRQVLKILDTPYGLRLLEPPFDGWDPQAGRISLKIPGTTENGSVYCHGSAFGAYGLGLGNHPDEALDLILRTLPGHPGHRTDIPVQIPVYQPNSYFYLSNHPQKGLSTGTLGTGTCTWIVLTVLEIFFGLGFTPQGLLCRPRFPSAWPEATIRFVRHSTSFSVQVRRLASKSRSCPGPGQRIRVNGKLHAGGPIHWEGRKRMVIKIELDSLQ
jgi:cellobiose phosphorylase/cellobionic acid phosphorylase